MNLPTSVVITGCDSMRILEQAWMPGARSSDERRRADALLAKTAKIAAAGGFELYKTSQTLIRHRLILNGFVDRRGADQRLSSGPILRFLYFLQYILWLSALQTISRKDWCSM